MRTLDAAHALRMDRRSPVLYLRSFQDDSLPDPTLPSMSWIPYRFPRPSFVKHPYERSVTRVLQRLGPTICLGRPGERYPEVGAARLYVSHSDWRQAVAYLMAHAAAVVLTVGRTESLWWEIDTALTTVPRERLLFFFPYCEGVDLRRSIARKYWAFLGLGQVTGTMLGRMDKERQDRYATFREKMHSHFRGGLPPKLGTSLFMHFADDGSPKLLETWRPTDKALMWRFSRISWTQVNLDRTLRPFLKKTFRSSVPAMAQ